MIMRCGLGLMASMMRGIRMIMAIKRDAVGRSQHKASPTTKDQANCKQSK
jgi:hypothetical protein